MSKTRLLKTLLLIGVVPTISGCNFKALSTTESTSNTESSNTSESSSDTGTNNDTPSDNNGDSSSTSNDPKKVIVPAHTLKDTNPPINVNSLGQRVTESVWNSYKYGGESAFNKNYNYTYRAWSLSGESTREQFTKNGYYMKSSAGALYYERKSGSTFYQYIKTSEGYLRGETSLDLQSKYTYRWSQEVYVHMYDFNDYEFIDEAGCYNYPGNGFCYQAEFHNGYLTRLYAYISGYYFEINASFETTINIPESYYYE